MAVPTTLIAPGVTACFRYTDLLDFDRINSELKPNDKFSPWTYSWSAGPIRHYQKTLTIAQVFNYTPPVEEAVDGCRVRTPRSYELIESNYSYCSEIFRVKKFFVLEYICYKYQLFLDKVQVEEEEKQEKDSSQVPFPIDPTSDPEEDDEDKTKNVNFTFLELTNTPAAPGLIFSISFSKESRFNMEKYSKFMVHTADTFPYKAVGLSPVIDKSGNSLSERSLTYFKLTKKLLPAPFLTNCFDYRSNKLPSSSTIANHKQMYQSRSDCHQSCVKRRIMNRIQKIPFSSIETKHRNMTPLGYEDVLNQTILNELIDSYQSCQSDCIRPDCDEVTTFTRVSSTDQNHLEMVLNVQNEPSIGVQYQPVLSFPEYFTYFLSCFGTWFGISVIALNPFKHERVEKFKKITKSQLFLLLDKGKHFKITNRLSLAHFHHSTEHASNSNSHLSGNSSIEETSFIVSPTSSNGNHRYQSTKSLNPVTNQASVNSPVINPGLINSPLIGNPHRNSNPLNHHVRHEVARQVRALEIKIKHLENVISTMQRSRTQTI